MADALGSVRKVLQNGRPGSATFSAVTYKPFGPVVTSTGSDKFTYAGEMLDSSTGLVYLFARYYDPELGRFYALDPELGRVSNPLTLNRYVYCGNNPTKFVDPTGKFWHLAAAIGICFAAGFLMGVWDSYTKNDLANWWKYGFAGGITWSEFPLILVYGKNTLLQRPGVTLGLLSGEYAFLKTYFLTGDLEQSTVEGVKGGITGYILGRIFKKINFPGIKSEIGGFGTTLSGKELVEGIMRGVFSSLLVDELEFKYNTFMNFNNALSKWWDKNNPLPKWLPIGKNPCPIPLDSCQLYPSVSIISSIATSAMIRTMNLFRS